MIRPKLDFEDIAAFRLGFGHAPGMPGPRDTQALLDSLVAARQTTPAQSATRYRETVQRLADLNRLRQAGNKDAQREYMALRRASRLSERDALRNRLARAVDAPVGFGERMLAFWADHFSVRSGSANHAILVASYADEALRPNLTGSFGDLLFAAVTHPAMLLYLDQHRSIGPRSVQALRQPGQARGLNENLAREIIELHSLGAGADYTQNDVRELAELLTGLTFGARHEQNYRRVLAEPGAETVLGQTYSEDSLESIRAVMSDLARHPATARHLARKLAVHFVSDTPPEALVADLEADWLESDGDLSVVAARLVGHSELAATFGAKVRQPWDYVVAALRALGLDGAAILGLKDQQIALGVQRPLVEMGQKWLSPDGPDGFPEAADAWITPQGLAARVGWAMGVTRRMRLRAPEPVEFLRETLRGAATPALELAISRAETRSDAVGLVLGSITFNRR